MMESTECGELTGMVIERILMLTGDTSWDIYRYYQLVSHMLLASS